jgi:uncharacterized protein YecE (DUF72 family)
VEFRHASWYDDEVFSALNNKGVALCGADTDDEEARVVATADFGYLRLRRVQYAEADLAGWAQRVLAQPWQEAFVFFKHEDAGTGPKLARQFAQACEAAREQHP